MIDKIQQQPQKKTHSAKTVADRNTNLIKVEQVENVNLNINNDNEITTRIPKKLKRQILYYDMVTQQHMEYSRKHFTAL